MTKDNHYGALDTWISADCQSEDKTNAELRDGYFTKLRDQGDTMSSAEYAATCRAWHIFSLKAKYEKNGVAEAPKQDRDKDLWSFITTANQARRANPDIDFKEIERIHKEWERYDLDGRYRVGPNDPKGPRLKASPKFEHGCTIAMRSSGDKD